MTKNRRLEGDSDGKASKLSMRYVQCVLIFFGLATAFAQRVNLSVAIVAMTDKQAANPEFTEFSWSEKVKSMLLSSFFWGYICMQVPAGQLARKFGGKIMLLWGLSISSVLTLFLPYCAVVGDWKLICGMRVIQGVCQGVFFPSSHTILSKWAPVEERGTMGTISYSGAQFGTITMLATSGLMASSSFGWPSIFYSSGVVGLFWSVAWYLWGASSPSEHKQISPEERKFIENSLGHSTETKPTMKTPWMKFFTSIPMWVLLVSHSADNWGYWTLLTQMPTYMKNILGMDIKKNAVLSALPYLAMFVMGFFFSALSAMLNRRKVFSVPVSRKLFNTIGQWGPMLSLVALSFVGKNQTNLVISLLVITVGLNSSVFLGFIVNHMDLSPNFAGVMFGYTNFVANIMSLLAPLMVGFIVTDERDPSQWRIIFFIAAGYYFIGNLLFMIFGSTKTQPWNNPNNSKEKPRRPEIMQMESQH